MQVRTASPDLRTFQRDLRRVSPALGRAFNAELGRFGRETRNDARANFENAFTSQTGDAVRSINSSASRGRVSVYIDPRKATDPKGYPYPVGLHQGFRPGGRGWVPGSPFLDDAVEKNAPRVLDELDDIFGRTVDRYLAKTGGV